MAGRLTGIQHELLVKSGDVWTVLSQLIAEYGIDLVVLGTRGRTGVWKLFFGIRGGEDLPAGPLSRAHGRPEYFGARSGDRSSTDTGSDRLCAAIALCGGVRAVAGAAPLGKALFSFFMCILFTGHKLQAENCR